MATETKGKTFLPKYKKSPSVNVNLVMNLPAVPAGEDEAAFKQHNKRLIAESERNNPRMLIVNECMKKSFKMRCRDLLSKLYNINSVFEKYPFLREPEQVRSDVPRFWRVVVI